MQLSSFCYFRVGDSIKCVDLIWQRSNREVVSIFFFKKFTLSAVNLNDVPPAQYFVGCWLRWITRVCDFFCTEMCPEGGLPYKNNHFRLGPFLIIITVSHWSTKKYWAAVCWLCVMPITHQPTGGRRAAAAGPGWRPPTPIMGRYRHHYHRN